MTGIDRVGVVRLPARMTRSHSMGAREFPAVSRSSRYTMILQLPGALPLTSSSGAKPLRVALTRPCWQPSAGVSTSSGKTDDFTAAVARAVAALFIGRPKRRHRIATGRVDRFANDIGPPMCDDGCLQEAADGVRRGHPRRTLVTTVPPSITMVSTGTGVLTNEATSAVGRSAGGPGLGCN
jgi:hypothetical protein